MTLRKWEIKNSIYAVKKSGKKRSIFGGVGERKRHILKMGKKSIFTQSKHTFFPQKHKNLFFSNSFFEANSKYTCFFLPFLLVSPYFFLYFV